MNFLPTEIPEVIRIQPKIYNDNRGFFMESYKKFAYDEHGINYDFVQENHSSSCKATLRGIHYQVSHTQGKLVRVVIGSIFDIAVDLRRNSNFFGKWVGFELSETNKEQLWIPPGFGHGFYALSERADVVYKATDYYDPNGERCIHWNDPDLAIEWPIHNGMVPLVSKKDTAGVSFAKAEVFS